MHDSQIACDTERHRLPLDATLAEAPIGTALVSLDLVILRVNRALCELLGVPEPDLLASPFQELFHPDDLDASAGGISRVALGEIRAHRSILRCLHRRGRTLCVSFAVALARDPFGRPLHLIAQFDDVTAIEHAHASLREANARLQTLFDQAPAWMALRGLDGRFLDVNALVARGLGVSRDELIGSHPSAHVKPEVASQLDADDHRVWETRAPISREIEHTHDDGDLRTLHLTHYPVLDASGEVTAIGTFAMDISERRRLERTREEALQAFEEAQRITKVGSWTWDPATGATDWSPQMFRIFGRDPADGAVPPSQLLDYVVPDDRGRVREGLRMVGDRDETFEFEYRILAGDGAERTIRVLGRHDPTRSGVYAGTCQDVTQLRAVEAQRSVAEERFQSAFQHAPVGMLLADLEGRYVQVNDALCRMLGRTREQLLASGWGRIVHPEDLERGRELARRLVRGEVDHFQRETRLLRASGEPVWVQSHVSLLRDPDGRPFQFIAQVLDITDRLRLERELRHLADHDPLTGLLNRRGFAAVLERHAAYVNRYGSGGALLVLDLDHFKTVNDTLGHEAGDRVIASVARILTARLRDTDTIARLGGDEFAILLPHAGRDAAAAVAAALVDDIHTQASAGAAENGRRVTASVGVTTFEQGLHSGDEALVAADLAMYQAKQAGRDRIAVGPG